MDWKDNLSEDIRMLDESMLQGRQYERFSVDFMDIHGKILFNSKVKILNISVGGVAFRSDKRLTIGGTYVLRLESKGMILHLQGLIIWTTLNDINREGKNMLQTYTVGMKFTHGSATREREIEKFIKDNFKDYQRGETFPAVMSGLRIHVRFLIHEPEKAVINCAEHYRVKRIAQNGMLIESDNLIIDEDVLPMEITLSDNRPITLWGKIITCQAIQDTEPARYEIGIEFIDMSEKDNSLLREFVASLEK